MTIWKLRIFFKCNIKFNSLQLTTIRKLPNSVFKKTEQNSESNGPRYFRIFQAKGAATFG